MSFELNLLPEEPAGKRLKADFSFLFLRSNLSWDS